MRAAEFAELAAFVAVAERGSFVRAATTLGIAPSTLSQTIRALEERLAIRLFNRTTRSVALTEAGERLLAEVRPALERLDAAIEAVGALRDNPAGTLRLNVASLAAAMVVAPLLGPFRAAYPEITLDVVVDDGAVEIVSAHFDAGIRPDGRIDQDMVAARISRESRFIAVASPDYLARHGAPRTPQDLRAHNCIRFRLTTGETYPWVFERAGERLEATVGGTLVTNDPDLILRAALEGVGVGYAVEAFVAPYTAEGRLAALLDDWAAPFSGYHIYYPSRRHIPAPLRVFVEFARAALAPELRPTPTGSDAGPRLSTAA
jgi:DNA-binding transcriptional LysR family regulator